MIKSFYEEHLHIDEEIRYIIDGKGYEDVLFPGSADRVLRLELTFRFETRMNDGYAALCRKGIS